MEPLHSEPESGLVKGFGWLFGGFKGRILGAIDSDSGQSCTEEDTPM